jgi:membrane-associated protein
VSSLLVTAIDVVLHLDRYLSGIIQDYGPWTYGLLFLIVFCETGLVITPFLPGDSLLFAVGTFAALGALDVVLVMVLLAIAAVLGDAVNYAVGRHLGPRVFTREGSRWLNPRHLDRTREFYARYGAATIVLARFVPIVRTFAPFVAGIGRMGYPRFAAYNVLGAVVWIGSLTLAGYFFGNIALVRRHFSLVILVIVALSVLPAMLEMLRQRRRPA